MTNRRAKIVATLGPSSNSTEQIKSLIDAGLNVARMNMSHGTHEAHAQLVKNIREASKLAQKEVAILLDLQGPKIRVDKLPENIILKEEDIWVIGASSVKDNYPQYKDNFIPTVYENLVSDAHVGARILFDDGNMAATAIEKDGDVLKIKISVGGELKSNKGINLPDVNVSAPSLTQKDEEDLYFGLSQGIDYIALSFVRCAEDILKVKYILHKLKVNIPIISKIEKPEAIENIDEIINVSDVIMIARGDMGVEVGNHLVPSIQKNLIERCNQKGVPVITATQMLESMITNAVPTRAEASDVANAIWDGTDAIMLSGETASGKYPVEAITMMSQIVIEAEKKPKVRPYLRDIDLTSVTATNMVAASLVAEKSNAEWIVSITEGGNSCLKISRFRPITRVLGLTNSIHIVRKMCLFWGVEPLLISSESDHVSHWDYEKIKSLAGDLKLINGDRIVITHGDGKYFQHGYSNSIRVEIIREDSPADVADKAKKKSSNKNDLIQQVDFEKGSIVLDSNMCSNCQNCISACPHDIYMVSKDGSRETVINQVRAPECTLDMECVNRCPAGAIEIIPSCGHNEV
jgi:pyruvate kinase